MAIPDLNHKVCMMCDHYTEEDCPYCGMRFEGFSVEKHDEQIRVGERERQCDKCDYFISVEEAYQQGYADATNKFVVNALTEFQKFDKEHGYPTLADISVILCDVAEQLKDIK